MEYDAKKMTEEQKINVTAEGISALLSGDKNTIKEFVAKISDPVQNEEYLIKYLRTTYLGDCENAAAYLIKLVEDCKVNNMTNGESALIIGLASRNIKMVSRHVMEWMINSGLYSDNLWEFLISSFTATDEQMAALADKLANLERHTNDHYRPGMYL